PPSLTTPTASRSPLEITRAPRRRKTPVPTSRSEVIVRLGGLTRLIAATTAKGATSSAPISQQGEPTYAAQLQSSVNAVETTRSATRWERPCSYLTGAPGTLGRS